MSNVEELERKFGINGAVRIEAGLGSLPRIVVSTQEASAEIYLHGAHVAHFQPHGSAPVLFLSRSSFFDGHKPIRGGIPLVFPWFGPRADLPALPPHGFARTRQWEIESCDAQRDGSVRIVLTTGQDETTLPPWPHSFSLRFIVMVSGVLDAALEVTNTSRASVRFEEALHTYLAVGDIRKISVEGLDGADYIDRTDGEKRKKEQAKALGFGAETDRLYLTSAANVTVRDPVMRRSIVVEKQHSNATVVWNPWSQKAAQMADMGADEWQRMVCIETANARACAVELAAGATHRMSTRIGVEAQGS
ncbi:MAG: D-hexose-6-phosphate mutarotase [Tepidisphaeraceae bacterium]